MSVVINGTTGITSPSPFVLEGSTSGTVTVAAPAVAGTNTQTLVAVTGTLAPVVSGTAVASTSGTSIDFTNIPSWVKRITVMLAGVSLTTTASVIGIRIGAGSFDTSGYVGGYGLSNSGGSASAAAATAQFSMLSLNAAADTFHGSATLSLIASNQWVLSGVFFRDGAIDASYMTAGSKTLSDVLTTVRITTVNGTDQFDAGTINILYE